MPLHIKIDENSDDYIIEMAGVIDESVKYPADKIRRSYRIVFDFDKLARINSYGLQMWSKWMLSLGEEQQFVLKNLRPQIVRHLNNIQNLLPKEYIVESFYLPFECDSCGHVEELLVRRGKEYIEGLNGAPAKFLLPEEINCDKCKEIMKSDVWPKQYLKFLQP